MSSQRQTGQKPRNVIKQLLSVLTVIAMSFGFAGLTATAANAALPTGITQASIVMPGADPAVEVTPGQELPEGQKLQLRVSYDSGVKGSVVNFKLGDSASLDLSSLDNNGIESYEIVDGNTVRVTFKSEEDWPVGLAAGVFRIDFKLGNYEGEAPTTITWEVGSEKVEVDVNITNPNPPKPPVVITEGYGKGVNPSNINSQVNYVQDGENNWRFGSLKNTILDQVLTYTLTVNVPNGAENVSIPISDQLPDGMQYVTAAGAPIASGNVPVSVGGEQWDLLGTVDSKTTATGSFSPALGADGRSFSGTLTASGAAKLTLTYQVKITDKSKIETLLAAAQPAAGSTGGFKTTLTNTANFKGANTKTAGVNVNGNLVGPCTTCDSTFSKSSDWGNGQKNFITDENGKIVEPDASITYKFAANLSTWNGVSPAQTLNENVVISDTLPTQAEWSTGAGFISVIEGAIPGVAELTKLPEADPCTVTSVRAAEPGSYCVDGNTLRINIGKDKSTNVQISAKAKLTSLAGAITGEGAGLKQTGSTTIKDGVPFRFRNVASFSYKTTDGTTTKQTDILPVELPDNRDNGINDSSVFTKEAVDPVLNVDPDSVADVKYKFTINTAKTPAVETLQITDDFDENYFPLTADNLFDPNVVITGTYDGEDLDQADFNLSLVDGKLVIVFSAAGKAKLNATGEQLDIYLTLRTRQLDGKETLAIKNFATLSGVGKDSDFWSDDNSEATSYDAEIAIEKRVWDKNDSEWTRLLKTGTNEDGTMVQNRYIYQIEFRSYDNFTDNAVINVVDKLADSAKFIGFVKSDDPADWNSPNAAVDEETQTRNSITGTFDEENNEVVLSKPQGTWYPAGATIPFRILVEIEEGTKQVVNGLTWNGVPIPPTETVVDIVGQPSIDIEKWTAETVDGEAAPGPVYNPETGALTNDGYVGDFDTDPDPEVVTRGKSLTANTPQVINFTVSNDGPDRLLNINVTDIVNVGDGVVEDLKCDFPDVGESTDTTWEGPMEVASQFNCTGTLTGVKLGETHRDTAKVTAIGEVNPVPVEDEDEWNAHVKSFAVGDYVWIDSDRDGLQGDDESPLEGVKVELLNEKGELITDRVAYTDERGRYRFDNLPAGTYQVRFTLTDEQGKRYRYTSLESGENAAAEDSNAAVAEDNRLVGTSKPIVLDESNEALTKNEDGYDFFDIEATEGIDPTWDAGVTEIQYAVGDYVWIDADKDGVQDANEKPLAGVKVELLDGNGKVVSTTTTDSTGRYIFDRLFAGTYQVRFTLTPEQARWYEFTKTGSGNNANDSNAHVSGQPHIGLSKKFELGPDNLSLTQDYDREFWASEGIDPTWDAGVIVKPENLATTGMTPQSLAALLASAGVMLLGGVLLTVRRRNALV